MIMLCVLIYVRTGCGLRTVISIIGIFEEVMGKAFIESAFGILKAKVSPNKLNGFTPMVLILPLYPKITVCSDAEKQNFKVRLANVKLKDIDLWAKENLSPNRVALRSKTLNKTG